jgi:hypothetical protein
LTSKFRSGFIHLDSVDVNPCCRQNPALIAAADKAFVAIALALEAETIQGQTAVRAAESAKHLVQAAGIDAGRLLSTLSPETQQTVQAYLVSNGSGLKGKW